MKRPFATVDILLAISIILVATGIALLMAPPVHAANPSMELWDCANGISGSVGGCDILQSGNSHGWTATGNIGNSSHYTYGDVVPWRIEFMNLPTTPGTVVAVTFLTAFAKSPAYDFDYMANWYTTVYTVTSNDPCVGTALSASCTQSSIFPLPQDPTESAGTCPAAPAGNGWTFPAGSMQGYGGITINDIVYNGTHACDGSTVDASVTVTFTTSGGADAILLWGMHIASPTHWVTVPGSTESPYHVQLSTFSINGVPASPCSGCGKQLQLKVQDAPTAVTLSQFFGTRLPARVALAWSAGSALDTTMLGAFGLVMLGFAAVGVYQIHRQDWRR